jgi:hypothetical protein
MTTQNLSIADLTVEQIEEFLAQKKNQKKEEITAYKSLVSETIPVIGQEIQDLSNYIAETKASVFRKLRDILSMKADVFSKDGKKAKTGQQTHSFSDDKFTITVGYRINDGWDDTASQGVTAIDLRNYMLIINKIPVIYSGYAAFLCLIKSTS